MDPWSISLFKVTYETLDPLDIDSTTKRYCTLNCTKLRTVNSQEFDMPTAYNGRLRLTEASYQHISDLDPEMGNIEYEGRDSLHQDDNMNIDFVATDGGSRVVYVGTSREFRSNSSLSFRP